MTNATRTKTARRPPAPPAADQAKIEPVKDTSERDPLIPLRKVRLRELLAHEGRGGAAAFARKAGMTHSYITQLSKDTYPANFGARAARELEQRLGLAHMYFDTPLSHPEGARSAHLVPVVPWGILGRVTAPPDSPVIAVGWQVGPRAVAAVSHGSMWTGESGIPRGWYAVIDPDAPRHEGDILAVWLPGATECTLRQAINDGGHPMLAPLDPRIGTIDEMTRSVKVVGPVVGALKSFR